MIISFIYPSTNIKSSLFSYICNKLGTGNTMLLTFFL